MRRLKPSSTTPPQLRTTHQFSSVIREIPVLPEEGPSGHRAAPRWMIPTLEVADECTDDGSW
jgi:hypothetical protein